MEDTWQDWVETAPVRKRIDWVVSKVVRKYPNLHLEHDELRSVCIVHVAQYYNQHTPNHASRATRLTYIVGNLLWELHKHVEKELVAQEQCDGVEHDDIACNGTGSTPLLDAVGASQELSDWEKWVVMMHGGYGFSFKALAKHCSYSKSELHRMYAGGKSKLCVSMDNT